jgi:hypothetical protein
VKKMAGTPIDQVVHEQREDFELTLQDAMADGVLTNAEKADIAVGWAELTAVINEVCGTISVTRSYLAAGISSAWCERKAREHTRDMAGTIPVVNR